MQREVLLSVTGLMLLTSGYENISSTLGMSFSEKSKASRKEEVSYKDVGEKNIDGKWQGKSRPTRNKGGFFARADVLYWRADEEGLESTASIQVDSLAPTVNAKILRPTIEWDPGFRVGMGYTFSQQDYWDLGAVWTHFQTHQSNSQSAVVTLDTTDSGPVLVPMNSSSILGSFMERSSVNWKLHYNVYDLDLGRDYFVSKTLAVHPYVGVRGATIQQDYKTSYLPNIRGDEGSTTSFHAKTKFWGVGAHLGTTLKWHIDSSFAIVGSVGGSLLYSSFKLREKYNAYFNFGSGALPNTPLKMDEHLTTGSGSLEGMLGIAWQYAFNRGKQALSLTLGYEWNKWFSQNRVFTIDTFSSLASSFMPGDAFGQKDGDLTLQGANLQIRFDF